MVTVLFEGQEFRFWNKTVKAVILVRVMVTGTDLYKNMWKTRETVSLILWGVICDEYDIKESVYC